MEQVLNGSHANKKAILNEIDIKNSTKQSEDVVIGFV